MEEVTHKKILEAAGEMPDATMVEVASEVSGASTDLVERVLREYGDPAAVESDPEEQTASDGGSTSANGATPPNDSGTVDDDSPETESGAGTPQTGGSDAATETADETTGPADASPGTSPTDDDLTGENRTDDGVDPEGTGDWVENEPVTGETEMSSPDGLTEKERAVLEVVAERPTATQQEVADVLGVSRATVSKRASGIEGFDWRHRAAFVERVFDGEAPLTRGAADNATIDRGVLNRGEARTDGDGTPSSPAHAATGRGGSSDATGEVLSRLDRIEERLDSLESADASDGITDPKLAHKVVHACMESEHVSEDEELQVVSAVLNGDADN